MPMPPYPIYCYTKDCKHLATYKIAAEWSDGRTGELKTYGLCCEACLASWFRRARTRQMQCRLTAGETLAPAGIYPLTLGQRDKHRSRLTDLEEKLRRAE